MSARRPTRDGRTASLEQEIMDLYDAGMGPPAIAVALGSRASAATVKRILGYMRESTPERIWAMSAKAACDAHAAAIAATGRDYAYRLNPALKEAAHA
ncbi:MAG TPA: hypothetical protein VF409_05375 [Sphingomonas sp.]